MIPRSLDYSMSIVGVGQILESRNENRTMRGMKSGMVTLKYEASMARKIEVIAIYVGKRNA